MERKANSGSRNALSGFSIIEMVVALLFASILAAFAIPNINAAVASIRLRGAASSFAGLIQQARLKAVQKNKTYAIRFDLPAGNGAYVDLHGNGAGPFAAGDPMVQFAATVAQVPPPGGSAGNPPNLDDAGGSLGWTATTGNISFNPRGLPCNAASTPCLTNVNYIFYFSDGSGWSAASITSAGRAKVWFWNGSNWSN